MVANPFCLPAPPDCPPGAVVPALTPHAVSVSLPKWQDNVDYEEGTERMKKCMTSGYPRFFIHHRIQKVRSSKDRGGTMALPPGTAADVHESS